MLGVCFLSLITAQPTGFRDMPDPEAFPTFEAYSDEVAVWKAEMEKAAGSAQLPTVMGRYYCRPKQVRVRFQHLVFYCNKCQEHTDNFSEEYQMKRRSSTLTCSPFYLFNWC